MSIYESLHTMSKNSCEGVRSFGLPRCRRLHNLAGRKRLIMKKRVLLVKYFLK